MAAWLSKVFVLAAVGAWRLGEMWVWSCGGA